VVHHLVSIKQNQIHVLLLMKQNSVVHPLFFSIKQNQGPSVILCNTITLSVLYNKKYIQVHIYLNKHNQIIKAYINLNLMIIHNNKTHINVIISNDFSIFQLFICFTIKFV